MFLCLSGSFSQRRCDAVVDVIVDTGLVDENEARLFQKRSLGNSSQPESLRNEFHRVHSLIFLRTFSLGSASVTKT